MKRGRSPRGEAVAARPRGRPRSFDRDAALAAAMDVFWEKGYEAASVADLTAAMGINPPSLYAAFGDKEQLFLAAVERYLQSQRDACPYCEQPTARGAIETLLIHMAHELTEPCHPRGCLMQMASASVANASEALQESLARHRAWGRDRLRARIRQGIAEGDVPPDTDVNGLADFYTTIITGMGQQARDGASRRSLLATVERAMQLFPPARRAAARRREKASA